MRRKITIIILFIIVIGALIFYFSQRAASDKGSNGTRYTACYDEDGDAMNCKRCDGKGQVIVRGAGYVCEIKASDALKKCTYDEECNKGCAYQNASAISGQCRAFITNTYDGLGLCGRSKKDKEVNCNLNFN